MSETETENLNLSLTCAICLDIASADSAVETSCCHNLFCSPCLENIDICPTCRHENFEKIPAHFARRFIGNLNIPCPNDGCTAKITRSNLAKHLAAHCFYTKITCPDPTCEGFKCAKKSFLEHLTSKHEQYLLDNYEKLWQKQPNLGKMVIAPPIENATSKI